MSDVASVRTDFNDFYRVVGYENASRDPADQYHASTNYMRQVLRDAMLRRDPSRRPGEAQMAEILATGSSDVIRQRLQLTSTEVAWIRGQITSGGSHIVGMYRAALPGVMRRLDR